MNTKAVSYKRVLRRHPLHREIVSVAEFSFGVLGDQSVGHWWN